MDLLRDKNRRLSSYLLKFLKTAAATSEDYWELGATTSQDFRDLISKWFGRNRHVLIFFVNIMTLCKWFCCHRVILPFGKKNSERFFTFHFTHYPSYQKGKTVLGTTKTSREVVLEKLQRSLAQVRENGKLTNTLKSLITDTLKSFSPNHYLPFKLISLTLKKTGTAISG